MEHIRNNVHSDTSSMPLVRACACIHGAQTARYRAPDLSTSTEKSSHTGSRILPPLFFTISRASRLERFETCCLRGLCLRHDDTGQKPLLTNGQTLLIHTTAPTPVLPPAVTATCEMTVYTFQHREVSCSRNSPLFSHKFGRIQWTAKLLPEE